MSDASETIASPLTVIARTRSRREDHRLIRALADEEEAELIVVGHPITMSGESGPAARGVEKEAAEIERSCGRPVVLFDERLTTVTADRVLKEAELSATQRRQYVDKVAAAVLLQNWLDRRKGST